MEKKKRKSRRRHGSGRVFKRGRIWHISYYVQGREERESSKSIVKQDAFDLLARRTEEARALQGGQAFHVTAQNVLDMYVEYGRQQRFPSLKQVRRIVGMLEPLGRYEVRDLNPLVLSRFRDELARDYAASTVNGVLKLLRTAMLHAARENVLATQFIPAFPRRLKESGPREGFLEREDFKAIHGHLPPWAQDVFEFAYLTGWRRNEVLYMPWDEVNFSDRIIRLGAARSKNRHSRNVPIRRRLAPLMERRARARVVGVPFVFHREGNRIPASTWGLAFTEARRAAGLPHVILHDCRRTAMRNYVRAGASVHTAMRLVGWKSETIARQYNITSERDLEEAVERLEDYLDEKDGFLSLADDVGFLDG